MSKLSQDILNKIDQENIAPTPRWIFLLKSWVLWLAYILATLLGSIAFGISIFVLTNNEWDIHRYAPEGFLEYFILSIPYIWLLGFGIFAFVAYYNFRHTKQGYKTKTSILIISNIFLSIILGSVIYASGFGRTLDQTFQRQMPMYRRMINVRYRVWVRPEKGILAGEVTSIKSDNEFSINDFRDKSWTVIGENMKNTGCSALQVGVKVRIIGHPKEPGVFIATEIKPCACGADMPGGRCNMPIPPPPGMPIPPPHF